MKKLFILGSLVFIAGCLQTRDDLKAREEGRESQPKYNVPPTLQSSNPPARQAADEGLSPDQQEQYRVLNGRIEVLENEIQKLQQAKAERDQDFANKITLLTDSVARMENQIGQMSADQQAANSLAIDRDEASAGSASARKGPLAQAEDDYKNKNWKSAIVNFQKYRATKPNGKSYAAATYKMAVCFQEMGMKPEAKAFFEEIVSKYPATDDAKKAQFRLKQLR